MGLSGQRGLSRREDLVQTAFTELYIAWDRINRHEVLDGYVRKIVVRTYLDERRMGGGAGNGALRPSPTQRVWIRRVKIG